jgi:hypothetical protein
MSVQEILTRLMSLSQALPGAGQVWDYERMHILPQQIRAVHGIDDPESSRGWSVRSLQWYRRGRPGQHIDVSGYVVEVSHKIHARSLWEINDAVGSERDWRTFTDALCALFDSPLTLDGYAHRFTYPDVYFEDMAEAAVPCWCHDMELVMDITEKMDLSDYDTVPLL